MDQENVRPHPRRTVRLRLAGLVAACVLPVWICAGYLVHYAYTGKQDLVERHMAETARSLALAVDQELSIVQATAVGLTSSPALDTGDYEAFRRQVREVLRDYPNSDIIMADRDGQQVFNSYLPEDVPLPKRNTPESVRRVFETGRPTFSNLFLGAVTGRALVSLDMPVFQNNQVRYDLGMTIPAARFAAILEQQLLPPEWMATVLDTNNAVVARSQRSERLIGQSAAIALPHQRANGKEEDAYETVNLEGTPVLASFARAKSSGWGVMVSVPRSALMSELWSWLWWTCGGTVVLFSLGIALALFLGRGIARSIQALVPAAKALGEGQPIALGRFDLAETDKVARAMESASRLMQTRDAEREAADKRRIEAEELLAKHERIFHIVADNSQNWEYWNDPDGICQWVSPACRRISGYAVADFLGPTGIAIRDLIHPDDRGIWDEHIARVNSGETIHDEIQFRIVSRSGEIVHIGHVCSEIMIDGIGALGRRGCNRDITEQYRFEQALRESKDMADAANRAKSEFLANMSHEIRTPLNGVLSMLQLLDTTGLDPEQKEYVQMATGASKRLTRLLADILDLSKVESGKLVLQETEFALEEVRQAVLDIFAPMAREKGLDLAFDLDPRLPSRMFGDEVRLRQILLNLVGNAVKYTDQGAIRVRVAPAPPTSSGEDRLPLLFAVSDSGRGIPVDQIEAIFEPFVQAEGCYARRAGGVGLGLAIVKRLVALMGGTIDVESTEGRGTIMRVILPLAPAKPETPRPVAAQEPMVPTGSLAVLVVEDEAINRFAACRLLEKAGYRPTACQNGAEALELLGREHFDIVFMDIQMEGMDGIEATRRIRTEASERFDPSIPIIAMTAYAMAGDKEKFLAAGMDDYVAKPVLADQMIAAIGRVAPHLATAG
jgi:PAS domain S-box-containing protein